MASTTRFTVREAGATTFDVFDHDELCGTVRMSGGRYVGEYFDQAGHRHGIDVCQQPHDAIVAVINGVV